MVRDAIPRSDPASIAAAASGHDRSFRTVAELAAVTAPVLVFPGGDPRHPGALAAAVATLPDARQAATPVDGRLHSAADLARAVAPAVRVFLRTLPAV
ncbi:hypothetical protein ACIHAA_05730 [Streptomyces sp. NPDC052040]|uniref:hypothetical protein n=1 Tax=Streptomyces sp. NPDC052040 TaxID=3365682 RepID=UPI0037CED6D5